MDNADKSSLKNAIKETATYSRLKLWEVKVLFSFNGLNTIHTALKLIELKGLDRFISEHTYNAIATDIVIELINLKNDE